MGSQVMKWVKEVGVFLASSRLGTWLYLHVFPAVDRTLLRWTNGHLSVSLGQPILLLMTKGAKTGALHETPLLFFSRNDEIIVVASNGGRPSNPDWYYNLRARPQVAVTAGERSGQYQAREAHGEERVHLWERALEVNPAYAAYQKRAGERQIPVIVLSPVTEDSREGHNWIEGID